MPPQINSSRTLSRESWRATCPSNKDEWSRFLLGVQLTIKNAHRIALWLYLNWPKYSQGKYIWSNSKKTLCSQLDNLEPFSEEKTKILQQFEDMQKLHAFKRNKIVSNIVIKFLCLAFPPPHIERRAGWLGFPIWFERRAGWGESG